MSAEAAKERAVLKDSGIIDARTLTASHKRLAEILKPGMSVLDVGCGTGAITSGIAEIAGPMGRVVGIDNNPELIEKARQTYEGVQGLSFEIGDICNLPFNNEFDIVTSARVLQWLSNPQAALEQMVQSAKIDGQVLVLDYNHTKIVWEPAIPESMQYFYNAFLQWRSDAGMDNEIADHLPEMFKSSGLTRVKITEQNETTKRTDDDFQIHIAVWAGVASFKGTQMVNDGFIDETQRAIAEEEFKQWIADNAESQTMFLSAIEGTKVRI